MALAKKWTNEAYVSLHLVQAVLREVMPTDQSEWYPEHVISSHNKVDFYIKDNARKLEFLVEVKAAKTTTKSNLDDAAIQQLDTYLQRSGVKNGILIDPFKMQCYQVKNGHMNLIAEHTIQNPLQLTPVIEFLQQYTNKLNDLVDMRIIAIHASKGGVGKTTLTTNVAFELARRGNRVLVVDLDEQANSSLCLGVNKADELDNVQTLEEFEKILESFGERKEVIDFMARNRDADFNYKQHIYPSKWNQYLDNSVKKIGYIDVLPSSHKTRPEALHERTNAYQTLSKGLAFVKDDYDYVIIDTTPMFNVITENGLLAAQYLLIPSQMEYLSTYGIRQPVKFAREIAEDTNGQHGHIVGIVPVMTDKNSRNNKTIKALVKKNFVHIPLLQEISRATAIGQAQHNRVPLFIHAEQNKNAGATVAKQFADLTQQIIKRIDELSA